jgi:hypothetical protein
MKRLLSIGLCLLLLYHSLGSIFVLLSVQWQEEHELSERLVLYPSTDSMVEFHIPLFQHPNEAILTQKSPGGFSYRGKYYEVINLSVSGDTLHITGYVNKAKEFWQQDLLSLVNQQFDQPSNSSKKANSLLKLLVKEYYQPQRTLTQLFWFDWSENSLFASYIYPRTSCIITHHAPPPELA